MFRVKKCQRFRVFRVWVQGFRVHFRGKGSQLVLAFRVSTLGSRALGFCGSGSVFISACS